MQIDESLIANSVGSALEWDSVNKLINVRVDGSTILIDGTNNWLKVGTIDFSQVNNRKLSMITIDTDLVMLNYHIWLKSLDADNTNTARWSPNLYFRGAYWDGTQSVEKYIRQVLVVSSDGWNALKWLDQDGNVLMQLIGNGNGHLWMKGSLYPFSDASQDLGSSSYRWRDGYFSGTLLTNNLVKVSKSSGYAFLDMERSDIPQYWSLRITDSGNFYLYNATDSKTVLLIYKSGDTEINGKLDLAGDLLMDNQHQYIKLKSYYAYSSIHGDPRSPSAGRIWLCANAYLDSGGTWHLWNTSYSAFLIGMQPDQSKIGVWYSPAGTTPAWTEIFKVTSAGDVWLKGDLQVNGNDIKDSGGAIRITMSGTNTKITTDYGYVQLGPQNTGYCHFLTDRSQFYFNKQIVLNGNLIRYHNDSYLLISGAYGGENNGAQIVLYSTGYSSDKGSMRFKITYDSDIPNDPMFMFQVRDVQAGATNTIFKITKDYVTSFKKVYISGGDDVAGGTANTGYLLIGDPSGYHIAIDDNEIMAKASGTTIGTLYIQNEGGLTVFGGDIRVKGNDIQDSGGTSRITLGSTITLNASVLMLNCGYLRRNDSYLVVDLDYNNNQTGEYFLIRKDASTSLFKVDENGDIIVYGNDIKDSGGTTRITIGDTTTVRGGSVLNFYRSSTKVLEFSYTTRERAVFNVYQLKLEEKGPYFMVNTNHGGYYPGFYMTYTAGSKYFKQILNLGSYYLEWYFYISGSYYKRFYFTSGGYGYADGGWKTFSPKVANNERELLQQIRREVLKPPTPRTSDGRLAHPVKWALGENTAIDDIDPESDEYKFGMFVLERAFAKDIGLVALASGKLLLKLYNKIQLLEGRINELEKELSVYRNRITK